MIQFFRIIFTFLAIIAASLGILILTFYMRVTSPNLYTSALQTSGLYEQVSHIGQEYARVIAANASAEIAGASTNLVTNIIFGEEERPAISGALESVVEQVVANRVDTVVSEFFNTLDVEGKMQLATEEAIVQMLAWLRGETATPEIFTYIPSSEEVELTQQQGVIKLATSYIMADSMGLTNLPACTTDEQEDIALTFIDAGRLENVNCTSERIRPILIAEVEQSIPVQIANELQLAIEDLLARYNISPILDTVYELLLAVSLLKESLISLQDWVLAIKGLGVSLILLSIPLGIVALLLAKPGYGFRTFIDMTLYTGLSVLVVAVLYLLFVPDAVIKQMAFSTLDISNEVISPARSALFAKSLATAVRSIVSGAVYITLSVGVVISITGALLLVLNNVAEKNNWQKKVGERLERKPKKKS